MSSGNEDRGRQPREQWPWPRRFALECGVASGSMGKPKIHNQGVSNKEYRNAQIGFWFDRRGDGGHTFVQCEYLAPESFRIRHCQPPSAKDACRSCRGGLGAGCQGLGHRHGGFAGAPLVDGAWLLVPWTVKAEFVGTVDRENLAVGSGRGQRSSAFSRHCSGD